jgi:hypothetical protein
MPLGSEKSNIMLTLFDKEYIIPILDIRSEEIRIAVGPNMINKFSLLLGGAGKNVKSRTAAQVIKPPGEHRKSFFGLRPRL